MMRNSKPYAPSKPEANLDSVPVSVRSSLDLEAVTTPGATFLGVPRLSLTAGVGVWVPGRIPLIVGLANQPIGRCHRLGPPPLLDYVLFWGHKLLNRKLSVIL